MAKRKQKQSSKGRTLDMGKLKKKVKEVEDRSASIFHELKDGWNYFYICPPWSDENVLWKEVERHQFHVCPKRLGVRECLICKEIKRRQQRGDADFADEWRLKPTAYFNAIKKADLKEDDLADKIKVLRASTVAFSEILEWMMDEEVDPSEITAAYILGIKRKGKGLQTRYKVKFAKDPVDVSDYVDWDVLEEGLHNLDVIRAAQPSSDKEMRKAIRGKKDEDDFDDQDDDLDDDMDDDMDLDDDGDDLDDDLDVGDDAGPEPEEEDELFEEPEAGDDLTDEEEAALLEEMEAEPEPEPEPPKKPRTRKKKAPAKGKGKKE